MALAYMFKSKRKLADADVSPYSQVPESETAERKTSEVHSGSETSPFDQQSLSAKKMEGIRLAAIGKFKEAIAIWQEVLAGNPLDSSVHHMCAEAHLEVDEPWQALEAAKRATQAEPNSVDAFVSLGRAQLQFGDKKLAAKSLVKAMNLDLKGPQMSKTEVQKAPECSNYSKDSSEVQDSILAPTQGKTKRFSTGAATVSQTLHMRAFENRSKQEILWSVQARKRESRELSLKSKMGIASTAPGKTSSSILENSPAVTQQTVQCSSGERNKADVESAAERERVEITESDRGESNSALQSQPLSLNTHVLREEKLTNPVTQTTMTQKCGEEPNKPGAAGKKLFSMGTTWNIDLDEETDAAPVPKRPSGLAVARAWDLHSGKYRSSKKNTPMFDLNEQVERVSLREEYL